MDVWDRVYLYALNRQRAMNCFDYRLSDEDRRFFDGGKRDDEKHARSFDPDSIRGD